MRDDILTYMLFAVIIISLVGIFLSVNQRLSITGAATVKNVTSRVVITSFFSIAASPNLSAGIDFGTIKSLPSIDVNATGNYNSTTSKTEFYLEVSSDSNVNVDFCIKADGPLNTTGGDEIGLGNETWNVSKVNTASSPSLPGNAFTTTYTVAISSVEPGNFSYWRFWLDVPPSTPAGTYNNTVFFKGVQTGNNC